MPAILLYALILVVKTIEVTLATLRIVMITKGERIKGALIGFVEVIIWVIVVSTVLTDISSDPLKVVVYALGFAFGNYIGSVVEEKLGLGTARVETIVKEEHGDELAKVIREKGFAVTIVEGKGMHFDRKVLIMIVKRKRTEELVELIKGVQGNAFITVNEIKPIYGGHGTLKK